METENTQPRIPKYVLDIALYSLVSLLLAIFTKLFIAPSPVSIANSPIIGLLYNFILLMFISAAIVMSLIALCLIFQLRKNRHRRVKQ